MSSLARRVVGVITRPSRQPTTHRHLLAPPRAEVRVLAADDLLHRCGPEVLRVLSRDLDLLCGELGVRSAPEVAMVMAPAGYPHVEISLAGRPVALIAASRDPARPSASKLGQRALAGFRRRLPLLLNPDLQAGVAAHLIAVGCSVSDAPDAPNPDISEAETLIEQRASPEIGIAVAVETMRRVDEQSRQAVVRLREAEFRTHGVRYPDIRVELTDADPGTVAVRFNDVTLPAATLGPDADWAAVVAHLDRQLALHRDWFVRRGHVDRLLTDDLEAIYPELVAATRRAFSTEDITACLRELVRSGRRVRNVPRIMELMLEVGDVHGGSDVLRLSERPLTPRGNYHRGASRDPVVVAARLRKIAIEERWRLGGFSIPANTRLLDRRLEEDLLTSAEGAEWTIVRAVASDPRAGRIVTHTIEAIGPVRDALRALDRPAKVMACQELPPDVDLDRLPGVGRGAGRRGRSRV